MEGETPILALPGPQYTYNYDEGLTVKHHKIVVHEEGGQGRGTGWSVWDAAVATAKYLELLPEAFAASISPQSILELGSGTGLCGIAATAALNLPTTLTDLPEVIPSLVSNVALNPGLSSLLTVAPCDWNAPDLDSLGGPHGLIIVSDCVWLEHLVIPLVDTLTQVVKAAGPSVRVLLGYQSRSRRVDALLFESLALHFTIHEAEFLPGEPSRGLIQLHWLRLLQA